MGKRQFGFAFLLFVPYIAYWSYEIWYRWYLSRCNSKTHSRSQSHSQYIDDNSENCGSKDSTENTATNDSWSDPQILTPDDYKQTFNHVMKGCVTETDCLVLTSMLRSSVTTKLDDGLKLMEHISVRSSSEVKKVIHDCKLYHELTRLLKSKQVLNDDTVKRLLIVINNLSMSEAGQVVFSELIADLIDLCVSKNVQLADLSLLCLTNLSVTTASHGYLTKAIQVLYDLIDNEPALRQNTIRILINMSSNVQVVPSLLAARRPECAMELLKSTEQITTRWLRYLVNISNVVLQNGITDNHLPAIHKAASPETFYSFLYSNLDQTHLTNLLLTKELFKSTEHMALVNSLYKNLRLKDLSCK